jgi:hypothetical protein
MRSQRVHVPTAGSALHSADTHSLVLMLTLLRAVVDRFCNLARSGMLPESGGVSMLCTTRSDSTSRLPYSGCTTTLSMPLKPPDDTCAFESCHLMRVL